MSTGFWAHMPGQTAHNKMARYLGLDTSNYTTSVALYDAAAGMLRQKKQLLPVKPGEAGLRQSDAVFHHTRQLPQLVEDLLAETSGDFSGIGVSVKPRGAEGSYMPCFLCGEGAARMLAAACGCPVYATSHQVGHILAALYSADMLSLIHAPFLAFHVSGGTTDCVLCAPDAADMLRITPVSGSLDLKAGQAVDRVGLLLGLQFPCGPALEQLAAQSSRTFRAKPVLRGADCCLSGLENQCARMLETGEQPCDIARYCLTMLAEILLGMTKAALRLHADLPLVYAGGVMSNRYLRQRILQQYPAAAFAEPAFSCDNAAGTALFAALTAERSVGR